MFGIVRWGKLGGPLHRAGIERVSKSLEESGFKVQREVRIPTPNGAKSSRWVISSDGTVLASGSTIQATDNQNGITFSDAH